MMMMMMMMTRCSAAPLLLLLLACLALCAEDLYKVMLPFLFSALMSFLLFYLRALLLLLLLPVLNYYVQAMVMARTMCSSKSRILGRKKLRWQLFFDQAPDFLSFLCYIAVTPTTGSKRVCDKRS
jgi:hypothetical protein